MSIPMNDDDLCISLINLFEHLFPNLSIISGADEPYYKAPIANTKARIFFKENYPRSLLHEIAHYCLAGQKRRKLDDYGYWYTECGRTNEEQQLFQLVEARPQGLEKAMCKAIGIHFSPSFDDFSSRPISELFLKDLEVHYQEMITNPPPAAKIALEALLLTDFAIATKRRIIT
ncbi:elongation factor P hydroxylase [Psychrobacter sp. SCQQ22]|uniref:elongation factor P hydroxylase n=1 Tax=Psychrobacter sp. SCQQ22 TaxID=2792059 RepID=UPI0018CCD748|nr:elongation factor P hydroxylase [Psychrobacter sp. SCQQ22]MBH0086605.1 elongation factor P hydroxylase [Psychrobacter sp. SCQQ22]